MDVKDNQELIDEYWQLKIKHAAKGNTWATGDLFEERALKLFPE